jgi:hypothetical protein
MKTINKLTDIKKLSVFSYDYEVFWIPNARAFYKAKYPEDDSEVWGWCAFEENRIYIDEMFTQSNIARGAEILLHEWVHAGHEFLGLDDKSTEEQFTDMSAKMIIQYMKGEPEVFQYLFNMIHGIPSKKKTKPSSRSKLNNN